VATAAATTTTVVVVVTAATAATEEVAAAATTTLDTATTETTVSGPFSFGHAPSHLYTPKGHDSSFCFTISLATDFYFEKKIHLGSGFWQNRRPKLRVQVILVTQWNLV
jgi:hypothetical protein